MARVTAAEVRQILPVPSTGDGSVDNTDLGAIIDVANRLVTDVLGSAGLSTARLKDVELYLAAHLLTIREMDFGATIEQKVNETWAQYGGRLKSGLEFTRFGQTALVLDTSGKLAGATTGQRAAFKVVKPTSPHTVDKDT